MVIYVSETQTGIWIKADKDDIGAAKGLKIWWTKNSDMDKDYKDRSLTNNHSFPVYAIRSLGYPKVAVASFRVAMAEMGIKIKILNHIEFHALLLAEARAMGLGV